MRGEDDPRRSNNPTEKDRPRLTDGTTTCGSHAEVEMPSLVSIAPNMPNRIQHRLNDRIRGSDKLDRQTEIKMTDPNFVRIKPDLSIGKYRLRAVIRVCRTEKVL